MRTKHRKPIATLILLLTVLATGTFHSLQAEEKTLDRDIEPVTLLGSSFTLFDGANVSETDGELFAFAFDQTNGTWRQISFQFLEINAAGSCFDTDEIAGLDDNDKFLFMARDTGDSAPSSWIDDLDSRNFVRYCIEVTDPLTNKKGWVYLYRSTTLSMDPNCVDYVQHFVSSTSNLGEDRVRTTIYELKNGTNGLPRDLSILAMAGGSGLNLLDALRFEARAKLVLNVTIREDDFSVDESEGDFIRVKDGKICVVRELDATLTVDIPFFPDVTIDFKNQPPTFYYAYSLQTDIDIVDLAGATVSEAKLAFNHGPNALGMQWESARNSAVTVDGNTDSGLDLTITDLLPNGNWMSLTSTLDRLVHLFPIQPDVGGNRELLYVDNGNDRGKSGFRLFDGVTSPFRLSYKGYFLPRFPVTAKASRVTAFQAVPTGAQIAELEQNPLQTTAVPGDFGAVPVELVSFTANVEQNDVLLTWLTATESNNFGFDVERRVEEREWRKIAFVKGSGTTATPTSYAYRDIGLRAGTYEYRLKQIDTDGAFEYFTAVAATVGAPGEYSLAQNYPNPFNPTTRIGYQLAQPGQENPDVNRTTLKIYNLIGQEVRTLVDEQQPPGFYSITWNGTDDVGQRVPSGVYIYRLRSGSFSKIRKMVLVQ